MNVGEVPRKSGVPVEITFQMRLHRWLQSHPDISERELARAAGLSHVHVSRVRKGWTVPTLAVAGKLARAMGMNLSDLI